MSATQLMIETWKAASQHLGFTVVAPYFLKDGEDMLEYFCLVPNFGSPKGMLVVVGLDYERHFHVAQELGYGCSCLSESSEPYDRDNFIEMLNDWGWSGPVEQVPSWYSGTPWTS